MPINDSYPLEELIGCLRRYPLPRGRRITFEYLLIKDFNDQPADADRLAGLWCARRLLVRRDTDRRLDFRRHRARYHRRERARRVPPGSCRGDRGSGLGADQRLGPRTASLHRVAKHIGEDVDIDLVVVDVGSQSVSYVVSLQRDAPITGNELRSIAGKKFVNAGNPVSALVCSRQYVIPALRQMSGMTPPVPQFASLTADVTFKPALTNFLPAKLISNAAGQVLAMPVHTNTSGDFASLSGTDGYVELALEQESFKSGTAVPLHRWHL